MCDDSLSDYRVVGQHISTKREAGNKYLNLCVSLVLLPLLLNPMVFNHGRSILMIIFKSNQFPKALHHNWISNYLSFSPAQYLTHVIQTFRRKLRLEDQKFKAPKLQSEF